jgi:hypothetical protein
MAKSGVGVQAGWEQQQREREARWRAHVEAWRRAGGSQADYCRRRGLAPADFSWWKHELARRDRLKAAQATPPTFVPVALKRAAACGDRPCHDESCHCLLVLKNGRRLSIGPDVSAQRVAELAAALEKSPC